MSDDQLKLRAAPDKWPIKESGAQSTPFTDPASGVGREDDESTPRGSGELVFALESSWAIVEQCLKGWTTSMLNDEYRRESGGKTQTHTRQSVLLRLITHDAYHSGEISQILGVYGLPEIDLWRASL